VKSKKGRWFRLLVGVLLSTILSADPNEEARKHFRAGQVLGQAGDLRAAREEFRRAIELQADYAEAHYFLALTLIAEPVERLDWPQAAAECRIALKSRPVYPEALHLLGVSLAALGRQEEAIEHFQSALHLRPNYPEAHLDLGMAYATLAMRESAVAEYQRALQERPDYAEARLRLGKCYFEQGKLSEAREELEAALKTNPDVTDTHYLLGRVLLALHEDHGAQLELQQVKQLQHRHVLAVEAVRLSNAGLDAARQGNWKAAIQQLQQAIQKEPDLAIAHFNLGLILADTGSLDDGIEEVQKAISLAPFMDKMRATLDRMLERKTKNQGTTKARPERLPDTSTRHFQTGLTLAQAGDQLGAIGEYLRALKLEPANADVRTALAEAYRASGDTESARLEQEKLKWLQRGKVQ
jgi:tetratricopeptide (TPR) repeat protein